MTEGLLCKCEALSSNSSSTKKLKIVIMITFIVITCREQITFTTENILSIPSC
jgi:hypothetical protein